MSSKEHVVILVGTNPLPLWLAWSFLSRELPKHNRAIKALTFVHTEGTEDIARRLCKEIENQGSDIQPQRLCISAGNAKEIAQHLKKHLEKTKNINRIHLHFTGGTKAMVLAAWQGCEQYAGKEYFLEGSYLNPREGIPRLISTNSIEYAPDARRGIQMTLDDLARLHGLKVSNTKKPQESSPLGASAEEVTKPREKDQSYQEKGRKFELEVFTALQEAAKAEESSNLAIGVWWNKTLQREQKQNNIPDFQLDVVAMLGPQLLLVSCTTSDDRAPIKGRAFEAWHRARQLGGDEARVIVLSNGNQSNLDDLEENLHDDIGSEDRPIQLWGDEKQHDLVSSFQHYLRKMLR